MSSASNSDGGIRLKSTAAGARWILLSCACVSIVSEIERLSAVVIWTIAQLRRSRIIREMLRASLPTILSPKVESAAVGIFSKLIAWPLAGAPAVLGFRGGGLAR